MPKISTLFTLENVSIAMAILDFWLLLAVLYFLPSEESQDA